MYGKLHDSMYDGTLRQCWEAMAVWPHLIALCDADGVIDMHPKALHDRITIPLDIIETAIAFLEKPDSESRSPMEGGRRIVRLDEHRDWGWRIVNHRYYRDLASKADKREKAAERKRRERARKAGKPNGAGGVTPMSRPVTHVTPCSMQDASLRDAGASSVWDQTEKAGLPRSLIGKAIKDHGEKEAAKAVALTMLKRPAEPKSYFLGCLPKKALPDDRGGPAW